MLKRFERHPFSKVVGEMARRLENGESFSASLEPLALTNALKRLLFVGEKTERPLLVLRQIVKLLDLETEMRSKFWKMIRYPLVLATSLFLLFFFYALYVFPSLLEMSDPKTLPSFLQLLLHPAAKYVLASIPVLLLIFSYLFFRLFPLTRILRLKPLQRLIRLYYSYLFTIEVGSFIDAGFSLEETFRHLEQGQANKKGHLYARLHAKQQAGEPLAEALGEDEIIEAETIGIVHLARESGDLGPLLLEQATLLHEAMEEELEKKLLWIEPILYGGLTIMTGTLFLILYYPIQLAIQQLPF
ncbi:type II secretion system F family protein [Exiguobacterium sp. BMC-KP]|uniref:type II secretion system F family protein n=1 Tax=Exiguobacterium sp. BMC-KP TaxID=1684312 RepID=UPI001F216A9D